MIMHLGGDCYVETGHVLMILDYKEATRNKDTSLFLKSFLVKHIFLPGKVENKPKSVVITIGGGDKTAYISPISKRTLSKRGILKDAACQYRAN
ncbi:hypothetical protein LJC56_02115 [Christensenellaceae bacterium OttesenSCG-928-K19]|nr:hypothetical protein [Christensenellaceae bacterium OttesenSCG-928-K19]